MNNITPLHSIAAYNAHQQYAPIKSLSMLEQMKMLDYLADSSTAIAIRGEFNTGKGCLAQKLHQMSRWSTGPFHEVYCLAMNTDMIQDRLLGQVDFTPSGPILSHKAIERANHGTLFINGFSALSEQMQQHIINLIERINSVPQVYDSRYEPINFRLILTLEYKSFDSHRVISGIKERLERINPIYIPHPPLRERREDIPELAKDFLKQLYYRYDMTSKGLSKAAQYSCIRYNWPGNLREFKNAIEYALVMSKGQTITTAHLPLTLQQLRFAEPQSFTSHNERRSYLNAEKNLFDETLSHFGSMDKAAKALEISTDDFEQRWKGLRNLSFV